MAVRAYGDGHLLDRLEARYPSPMVAIISDPYELGDSAVRTHPGSRSAHRPLDPLQKQATSSSARTWRSSSRRCLSCALLTRSALPAPLASPGPTQPAWTAGQHEDDANGDGSIVAESSYEAVASAAQRDFSFKGDATSEPLRDLEDKLVKLKDEGLLNAYTGLALEVETCGEHTWYSKTQTILTKLRNSLLRLQAMATESLPSEGASILQYASISHREGRLGAFEMYLVMHSKESTTPTRKLLLHTKLKTQRFPNVSVIMKMLLKMLPRVMDFDEHRRVVALLADDNADLRHDLQKSSAMCSATEERLSKALTSYSLNKFSETELHQSRLRVHKELSKFEKKLAALSSVLAEGSSQHLQAAQESENRELDTRSACAELGRTVLEGLRRLMHEEKYLQHNSDKDDEEALRADLARSIEACKVKDVALANLAKALSAEKELALTAARDTEAAIKAAEAKERVLTQTRMMAEAGRDHLLGQLQNLTRELHILVDNTSSMVDGFETAIVGLELRLQDERVCMQSESCALKERVRALEAAGHEQRTCVEELQRELKELRQASHAAASQQQGTVGQMVREMELTLREYGEVLASLSTKGHPPTTTEMASKSMSFCKSLRITGCKKIDGSDFDLVNGDYSSHMANGLPFYFKVNDATQALWYDSMDRSIGGWRVGPWDKVGSTTGHASVMSDAQSPELSKKDWNVFTAGQWQKQSAVRLVKLE